MSAQAIPVWSWTDAVVKSKVPPLTKLVCLNIARYLSSAGKSWRVTVEQMMKDTGLAKEAMARHLRNAQKAGLLVAIRHHDSRGYRTVTEYAPRFPKGARLDDQPAEMSA